MSDISTAFPLHDSGHGKPFENGMTLRDYFAAKALQAFLRNARPEDTDEPPSTWAQDAYIFADAMLKAREQE